MSNILELENLKKITRITKITITEEKIPQIIFEKGKKGWHSVYYGSTDLNRTRSDTATSKPKQEQSPQEQRVFQQRQHERELEEFRKFLTELSNISNVDARRDAAIEAAQAHFFKALESDNWRLRADIIGTLNLAIGSHLTVTYVENWKTYHEAVKKQK